MNYIKWFHLVRPCVPRVKIAATRRRPLPLACCVLKVLSGGNLRASRENGSRFLFPIGLLSGQRWHFYRAVKLVPRIERASRRPTTMFPVSYRHDGHFIRHPTVRILRFPPSLLSLFFFHSYVYAYQLLVAKPTGVTRSACKTRGNNTVYGFIVIFSTLRGLNYADLFSLSVLTS